MTMQVEWVSIALEYPEWGWLLILLAMGQQLFAPWETKSKKMVSGVKADIKNVEQMQKAQMTVIRALARVHEEINTEEVDDYLVENGVEPDIFIVDRGEEAGSDGSD